MILGLSSANGGMTDCENCRHLMVIGFHNTGHRTCWHLTWSECVGISSIENILDRRRSHYVSIVSSCVKMRNKTDCSLFHLQRAYWPSGKILGGSSNVNAMLYIRGSRHDFDKWAKDGAEGWSYKDVLPYFLKSENNVNADYVKTGKCSTFVLFSTYPGRLTQFIPSNFRGINLSGPSNFQCWGRKTGAPTK